jgi:3-deoxy-D-manno-octulosonic-acid transferase
MRYLLDLVYLLAVLLLSPWLVSKALTTGKYRRGLGAKLLGRVGVPASSRPRAWFHGVSVGEVHLLRQVVVAFRQRHPDWDVVVSTTTDTGFDEATKAFPDLPVVFYPFDFSWAVGRALRMVNPSLIVLAESELWPNFLFTAKRRGIPVAIINGRLSPRSAARHHRLRWLTRPLWGCVNLIVAQNEEYAENYRRIGIDPHRVIVTGSVKFDGVTADRRDERVEKVRALLAVEPGDRVWVCGSTQTPEEEIVLEIYRRLKEEIRGLRLVIVPRQKDRFDEVASLLEKNGVPFVRRSQLRGPVRDREAVVLVDTIGELSAIWGLAEVAFVGGSLDGKRGGQNMIEPAAYGAAVVFGPHVWNFRDIATRLVGVEGAVQVADGAELGVVVRELFLDTARRERMGEAAGQFVRRQQGATAATMTALDAVLRIGPPLALRVGTRGAADDVPPAELRRGA